MAEIKFTKSELRQQQQRLAQLEKYLPTLQLKKAMLQTEVSDARLEIVQLNSKYERLYADATGYSSLLSNKADFDPTGATVIRQVNKRYENIAGVEVPYLVSIDFAPFEYNLFITPPWADAVVIGLRAMVESMIKISIGEEKKKALEKELREVSIRVNLFEKILIPRAISNIKKIKVFLGDQLLAAVSQAKVAKTKIEERKLASKQEAPNAT